MPNHQPMERRRFLFKSALAASGSFLLGKTILANISSSRNMKKSVVKHTNLQFKQAFPGLKGVDMMAHAYPIEPFLVFTEFRMDQPVFGPHPHAGISVMTYMLPDSKQGFINRDSQGDFSYIEPGGMHIMQAGSGMHHDEFPKVHGVETHGFQIWINHADKDRWVNPTSMHAFSNEIPEIITKQFKVRVIHGEFQGKKPSYEMVTAVKLFHVFLEPNASIEIDADEMAFVYGLNGQASIEGVDVKAQTLVNFSSTGDRVVIEASEDGFECMFASGKPHNEPITYGGPFVMTTADQMAEARRLYANGKMGRLDSFKE